MGREMLIFFEFSCILGNKILIDLFELIKGKFECDVYVVQLGGFFCIDKALK